MLRSTEREDSIMTQESLLRLSQILELIPISKSAWWRGCRDGKYPKPIKLSARTTVWKKSDIDALIQNLGQDVAKMPAQ